VLADKVDLAVGIGDFVAQVFPAPRLMEAAPNSTATTTILQIRIAFIFDFLPGLQ
jgi:hypothetical protein